jgi:glyceraldehyde 3-phosphate dehydrogenase
VRVGINGFGRIGRNFFRAARKQGADIDLIAVNDLGDTATMAHLLKYDSVLGPLDDEISSAEGSIRVADEEFRVLGERDPANLPWKELDVQVVLESTGLFTKREQAQLHLDAGAEKVVVSAPATDPDVTLVLGVNDEAYDRETDRIISNASCTTNCIGPVAKVLHDAFVVESGFMTTIHAYTNDQQILDLPHKDLRRARAAAINLIPTSTGAARAIGLVIPELKGKLDGISVRAPVADGSIVDFVAHVAREVTVDEVNACYAEVADRGKLEGILRYSDEPLVSTDIIGSSYSATFDSSLTMVHGNEVKVFAWYDNEWGYSSRLVDLVQRLL